MSQETVVQKVSLLWAQKTLNQSWSWGMAASLIGHIARFLEKKKQGSVKNGFNSPFGSFSGNF